VRREKMGRRFQIGDIVTYLVHAGTPEEERITGLTVHGYESFTWDLVAREYYTPGMFRREIRSAPENFILETEAPKPKPTMEAEVHRATLEILGELKEIKELLRTISTSPRFKQSSSPSSSEEGENG